MKLDDFCHPGGPLIISSCVGAQVDGLAAKKRIDIFQNDLEYATDIGVLTEKSLLIISQNYDSQPK